MSVRVLTQPDPLVSVSEAKLALGYDHTSDRDAQIKGLILAAQAELDGPLGWVGICVAEQQVEYRADRFSDDLRLPFGPIIGPVSSVVYLDGAGDEITMQADGYVLAADGRLMAATGSTWPSTYDQADAVRVVCNCGIEDTDDPRVAQMKSAIIMHVKMSLDLQDVDTIEKTIRRLMGTLWAPRL